MAEDRRAVDDKRYAVISKDAVRMFAETIGYKDVSDDVASMLSEDVTYRLREIVQHSCQFLRHGRRKKLTTEDINNALKNSDVPPIHGHGTQEMLPFRQTKEGELYFVDDLDINLPNLSYSNYSAPQLSQPNVRAYWLAVEGAQKPGSMPVSLQTKVPIKPGPSMTEDLKQYYDSVTKAVLGNEEEIMKLALVDIRTNTKIAPLMPFFINFFANGVRTVNHDVNQLTKLLHMVRAIVSNHALNLDPRPYLEMLVRGVLYCITDPLAASINPMNDHWKLRDYAARLLADISRDWESPMINLKHDSILALQQVLYDVSRPYCSHYGAVMGLAAFGTKAIEEVLLPHLVVYWPQLTESMQDNASNCALIKADAHKVHGAIRLAAEYVLKARITDALCSRSDATSPVPKRLPVKENSAHTNESNAQTTGPEQSQSSPDGVQLNTSELIGPILQLPEISQSPKSLTELYQDLYEYFGDSLAIKFPIRYLDGLYAEKELEDPPVNLNAAEAQQSGEQLLQQMLQAAEQERLLEVKTENHCGEHAMVDTEEKSERSSRSSRSGRSVSDENSSVDEDTDLTIRTRVSDPSQGIKLTILKRPKLKMTEDAMMEGNGDEQPFIKLEDYDDVPMPVLEPKPEPISYPKMEYTKTSSPMDIKDVFDIQPMVQNNVFFMFRFLGCEQLCSARRNSNRMSSVELIEQKPDEKTISPYIYVPSRNKLNLKHGKKRKKSPHFFKSCNMDCFL